MLPGRALGEDPLPGAVHMVSDALALVALADGLKVHWTLEGRGTPQGIDSLTLPGSSGTFTG